MIYVSRREENAVRISSFGQLAYISDVSNVLWEQQLL